MNDPALKGNLIVKNRNIKNLMFDLEVFSNGKKVGYKSVDIGVRKDYWLYKIVKNNIIGYVLGIISALSQTSMSRNKDEEIELKKQKKEFKELCELCSEKVRKLQKIMKEGL